MTRSRRRGSDSRDHQPIPYSIVSERRSAAEHRDDAIERPEGGDAAHRVHEGTSQPHEIALDAGSVTLSP